MLIKKIDPIKVLGRKKKKEKKTLMPQFSDYFKHLHL